MSPDLVFSLASAAVLPGWLALLFSPLFPRMAQWIAAAVIPLALSVLYVGLMALFFDFTAGDFSSLSGVMALFGKPELVLVGWVHYLVFDLLIGAWIVRDARGNGLWHGWAVICLPFTLMAGPAGFLLYHFIRFAVLGRAPFRSAQQSN